MGLFIESIVFTDPDATIGDAFPVTKWTFMNRPCCNSKIFVQNNIRKVVRSIIITQSTSNSTGDTYSHWFSNHTYGLKKLFWLHKIKIKYHNLSELHHTLGELLAWMTQYWIYIFYPNTSINHYTSKTKIGLHIQIWALYLSKKGTTEKK